MTDFSDFDRIRELSIDYYRQRITKQEYRDTRKELLNKIDKEINNVGLEHIEDLSDSRVVDKIMSFFKRTEDEKIL